jgi:hypothetical protein
MKPRIKNKRIREACRIKVRRVRERSTREPFTDIEDARALAQAIVDTVREPLLVLDGDLRVLELDPETAKHLDGLVRRDKAKANRPRRIKPGTLLVREYQGDRHTVTVVPNGYVWHETTYASLSVIARAITGTAWNGPRFFGLRSGGKPAVSSVVADGSPAAPIGRAPGRVTKTKPQLAVAARRPDGNLSLAASSLGDGERRP